MGLFKRKVTPINPSEEALAVRMANALLAAQRCSALWLNTKALKLGKTKVIVMLLVLGLASGLWFGWLIIRLLF